MPPTDRVMPMASHAREWHPLQVVYLAVAAIVLFVVTFWAALGLPPLGGTTIEWVLAFLLVSLVNLGLGTLGGGAVIEWRHPTWSRLGLGDHIVMGVALGMLLLTDRAKSREAVAAGRRTAQPLPQVGVLALWARWSSSGSIQSAAWTAISTSVMSKGLPAI